jgi:hypothetical protein
VDQPPRLTLAPVGSAAVRPAEYSAGFSHATVPAVMVPDHEVRLSYQPITLFALSAWGWRRRE